MKIAITGGTAGIGLALGNIYEVQGHEVVRLSRRNGYNIRSVPKVADAIASCDMFINNAQAGFAQTELLFQVCNRWQGLANKTIISISTAMAAMPICPMTGLDMMEYRVQKVALEEAMRQLRFAKLGIKLITVRPGAVATNSNEDFRADPAEWAQAMVDALASTMHIDEITIHPKR